MVIIRFSLYNAPPSKKYYSIKWCLKQRIWCSNSTWWALQVCA